MSAPTLTRPQASSDAVGTVTVPRPQRVSALATFPTVVATEARIWTRDLMSAFFGLVFPPLLLVGLSVINSGFSYYVTDMNPDVVGLDGVTLGQHFLPAMLVLAVASPAIQTFPTAFATFRENQVLRRLSATPMRPGTLLGAHLVVNICAVLAATSLVILASHLMFGLAPVGNLGIVVLGYVLGVTATFAMGTLLAAVLKRVSVAGGVTTVVFFANMILSGAMSPGPLEGAMAVVGRITPLGSAAQVITEGWFGSGFPALQVAILAAWTLVATPVAITIFRWS